MRRYLLICAAALQTLAAAGAQAGLAAGPGTYAFDNPATGRPVQVAYFKPENFNADTPVLLVLHGIKRNAEEYRDGWIEQARTHGLMVLVPHFDRETYRGANGYNLGNVFHAETHEEAIGRALPRQANPPGKWSFALPDAVFADFARREKTGQAGYTLYGHGAGAQFAQRFTLFMAHSKACRVMAANPGWYTYPDRDVQWPYGLGAVPGYTDAQLDAFLRAPFVLMLGEDDVKTGGVMRKSDGAEAQGPDRRTRGERFYAHAKQLADTRSQKLGWRLQHVADAGHRNTDMAAAAARNVQPCPSP